MAQLYRSRITDPAQARVVVIHCSDPRYQPHFQDFLRMNLGLMHYGLIAIPGGVQMLSPSEFRDAIKDHGAAWFDFMAKLMTAEHCILIGHADCRWYLENGIAADASCLKETQQTDLRAVRAEIHRRFPALRVDLYFAELQGGQAEFTAFSTVGAVFDRAHFDKPGKTAADYTD